MSTLPHEDVAPPGYEEVVSSTRYPVIRAGTRVDLPFPGSEAETEESYTDAVPRWSLRFVDFTPHFPQIQTSRRTKYILQPLVERANTWLQSQVHVTINSCETITWTANEFSRLNDTDVVKSTLRKPKFGKLHNMRGLRLWVVPNPSARDPPTLGVRDFVPDQKSDAMWNKNMAAFVRCVDEWVAQDESIGEIVGIETLGFPLSDNKNGAKTTYWTEPTDADRQYAYTLRVYYTAGRKNRDVSIGITDLVPRQYKAAGQLRYEGLESLVARASDWAANQPHVTTINMHTMLVRKRDVMQIGTNATTYWVYKNEDVGYLRCLRVVYCKPRTIQSLRVVRAGNYVLQKKTFAPQRSALSGEAEALPDELKYVTFTRTVEQVADWLANSGGAELLCVETLTAAVRGGEYYPQPDCTLVRVARDRTEESVAHVRIYVKKELNPEEHLPDMRLDRKFYPLPFHSLRGTGSRYQEYTPDYFRRRKRCCVAAVIILTCVVVGGVATVLAIKEYMF